MVTKTDALRAQLMRYIPWNEQEQRDREMLLHVLSMPYVFSRENQIIHFTASAWITDSARQQVPMAYHKIYDSWAWTGGHADGEADLLSVALREASEETGVDALPVSREIYSLEVLTVDGHVKRGAYVPSHLHANVTYLLEADPSQSIRIKADENSGVCWFTLDQALENCSEKWMRERIYKKLNEKLLAFGREDRP